MPRAILSQCILLTLFRTERFIRDKKRNQRLSTEVSQHNWPSRKRTFHVWPGLCICTSVRQTIRYEHQTHTYLRIGPADQLTVAVVVNSFTRSEIFAAKLGPPRRHRPTFPNRASERCPNVELPQKKLHFPTFLPESLSLAGVWKKKGGIRS